MKLFLEFEPGGMVEVQKLHFLEFDADAAIITVDCQLSQKHRGEIKEMFEEELGCKVILLEPGIQSFTPLKDGFGIL